MSWWFRPRICLRRLEWLPLSVSDAAGKSYLVARHDRVLFARQRAKTTCHLQGHFEWDRL